MGYKKMNTIDALYTIKYNPFKYSKYLVTFYSELTGVEQNLLLLPLLIPLFTHPIFKNKRIIKTSSLHTIFFNC
ncbi:three component ABC system middle component [Actinobacillus pleuropneumoniae]|uniref:three component ABC system middle component n=1 Tax=Actinobacillus pleuropneumoniae TaxID=715 RepID=UPI003D093B9C